MRVNGGFLAGVAWGGVVAGLGLAVISQVAPRPLPPGVEVAQTDQSTAERAVDPPAAAAAPELVAPPAPAADPAPVAPAPADSGTDSAPEAAAEPVPAPEPSAARSAAPSAEPEPTPEPAPVAPQPAEPSAAEPASVAVAVLPPTGPETAEGAARPQIPALAAPADAPASVAADGPGLAPAPLPATGPEVVSDVPPPAPQEALLTPPPAPEPALAPARVAIAQDPVPGGSPLPQTAPPAPDAAPDVPVARPLPVPDIAAPPAPADEAAPEADAVLQPVSPIIAGDAPRTLAPDPGLPGAEGVRVGQLPRIGAGAAPGAGAAETPATAATDAATTEPPAADAPPVRRFARPFDNPEAKPLYAILLRDTGAADLDRAALAQISFPVTFVIDPALPGAAEAAAIYRKAGQEVLMLASGIPNGATPADLEQSFQSMAGLLPESVGVMDLPGAGFQANRPLAAQVVPILATQGRGLVTFDAGLNAADQEARRAQLPSATIFRQLDAEAEEAPTIRRYLDRAAFKAAQEGRVVVLGETRPETVTALMEWAVEGRAASVALAPVTAVMSLP